MNYPTHWRKSSYSNDDGGACVEVAEAMWRKSTYSNADGGACVEVATSPSAAIPIRDSKLPTHGMLTIPTPAWSAFTLTLKT